MTGESAPPENNSQETGSRETGPELGRIERPAAAEYRGKRRLLLVPLVYGPPPPPTATDAADSPETLAVAEGQVILERYWEQAQVQVNALESGLGGLRRIYHESLIEGGAPGLAYLQLADPQSHALVQAKCQAGTVLEATESWELLAETLDWQRCLMAPLTSEKVAAQIQEWFAAGNRRRYEYIARQIDQTLQPDETGLLLINERHQVQFPADIEVFYVAPPALDEFRRWLQNWAARMQRAGETAAAADDVGGEGVEKGDSR